MSADEAGRYDEYWKNVGSDKALAPRDEALAEMSKMQQSNVVGGVRLDTGEVAVGVKNKKFMEENYCVRKT